MKIDGNAIRPGNVIEHQGGLWVAVKIQHTQPGKGGAYLQVELKNLKDGRKLNERFRSSEKVERVRLEQKEYTYLFESDGKYTFMDAETYDQVEIDGDLVGEKAVYLQDGMEVIVESYEDSPLSVQLPQTVELEVTETEPVVKGQTAASSNKPAILENGVRVMVPPFINTGDRIIVNTEDSTYVERAK
ncbi:elongation factor P [Luteithermobacter gelatinilyticus]|uniref:elongation factor P n=1 Tax=Luteithermobacter gelatinilyticus TaxID=2582913 RepID=UPI001106B7C2|nr:elongation factor P [Luteithermobacter gelatinilyticus]|tara:strand:- start:10307 stop:10870 length:564 start_codon:yes stop_codon:yes gene_type:complete